MAAIQHLDGLEDGVTEACRILRALSTKPAVGRGAFEQIKALSDPTRRIEEPRHNLDKVWDLAHAALHPEPPASPSPRGGDEQGLVAQAKDGLNNFSYGPGSGMVAKLTAEVERLSREEDARHYRHACNDLFRQLGAAQFAAQSPPLPKVAAELRDWITRGVKCAERTLAEIGDRGDSSVINSPETVERNWAYRRGYQIGMREATKDVAAILRRACSPPQPVADDGEKGAGR